MNIQFVRTYIVITVFLQPILSWKMADSQKVLQDLSDEYTKLQTGS